MKEISLSTTDLTCIAHFIVYAAAVSISHLERKSYSPCVNPVVCLSVEVSILEFEYEWLFHLSSFINDYQAYLAWLTFNLCDTTF